MKKHYLTVLAILWASSFFGQTLVNIESVEYDPSENRYFISNGNNIIQRSESGELSYFGMGAASYGMEVMGNTLFVIQDNKVYGYDLDTEEEVMEANVPGANFLNGMANDGVSKLWVTDFSAKKIHQIDVSDMDNPVVLEVVSNTVSTPNGIVYDYLNNRLVFVCWGPNADIVEVDTETFELTILEETSYGNIDGIDMTMQGDFYIASWTPNQITRYNNDFTSSEELSVLGLSSPADISYADATDSLAIPNSGNNTVVFYSENAVSVEDIGYLEEQTQLQIVPNPIMSSSEIRFTLKQPSLVKINLYDEAGRLVRPVSDGFFVPGKHGINLDRANMEAGAYTVRVQIGEAVLVRRVIFE